MNNNYLFVNDISVILFLSNVPFSFSGKVIILSSYLVCSCRAVACEVFILS